jgi:S-adenosylmethionine:tRNA ribosyltransferase-isomerase
MKLSEFDYNLPKELIAQEPIRPRDHSRLLILDKKTGELEHRYFYDVIEYFKKGDVLVLNNSKVMPARLIGKKKITGGRIEVFLLPSPPMPTSPPAPLLDRRGEKLNRREVWQCLIGGRVKEGLEIQFSKEFKCVILKSNNNGTWEVKFNKSGSDFMRTVEKIGQVPLPPYIKKKLSAEDKKSYQTIYADAKKIGSVAAPTAGFHFTENLLDKLKKKGAQIEYVTLHVGLGTFAPVKVGDITKHKMHAEWVEVKKEAVGRILQAKKERRRIVAVGTTSVRTLEALASQIPNKIQITNSKSQKITNGLSQWINIFIYPGYKFKIVDAMITNFHLPKSTLLMLVSAFASRPQIKNAYAEAIKNKYRFFSYGDAMLIK